MDLGWFAEQLRRVERWGGRKLFARAFKRDSRRMLLILGHMRTGSSLLVHILNSNPSIVGYGETGISYLYVRDFGAVTANVCRNLREIPTGKSYVLDKVLHKDLFVHTDILRHPAARVIFMLRRPDMALSSLVRKVEAISHPDAAYEHYAQQVEWIHQLSRYIPCKQWTYTTYSELVQDSPTIFQRLERFLKLSEPLSESYRLTQFTGVRGIGDPGPHIEAGCIKRNIHRDVLPAVREYVQPAQEHFERCCEALQQRNQY